MVINLSSYYGEIIKAAVTRGIFEMFSDCGFNPGCCWSTREFRYTKMLTASHDVMCPSLTYVPSIAAWAFKVINNMRLDVRRNNIFEFQNVRKSFRSFENDINFSRG